jgi:hypothetical protein
MSSDMRWNGTHECKSIWFELVMMAHSETPVGTLPCDRKRLSRMVEPAVDRDHFEALCGLPFGPLHGWIECRSGDGKRLMHPTVTRIVQAAFASRANNAARVEAASQARKLARLTEDIAQLAPKIASDSRKVRFISAHIEERISRRGGSRRTAEDLHFALQACVKAAGQGKFPEQTKT